MRKIDRRGENRCADFTTRGVGYINAVPKLDRTSMKNSVSKYENHCKSCVAKASG